jgi:Uma2 family endonuclease
MATTTTNLLSWEAFEQLPDDGMHREVLEGELITLPPPEWCHNSIALRIYSALHAIQDQTGFIARHEDGYRLTENPVTWIQPDVSFVSAARAEAAERQRFAFGAPELAVEIISPSESPAKVERKLKLLFAHGCQAVWVVYPKRKKVAVHRPNGAVVTLGLGDSLTLPELLPGWELPVSKLFD